jgi:hypothetical protein
VAAQRIARSRRQGSNHDSSYEERVGVNGRLHTITVIQKSKTVWFAVGDHRNGLRSKERAPKTPRSIGSRRLATEATEMAVRRIAANIAKLPELVQKVV